MDTEEEMDEVELSQSNYSNNSVQKEFIGKKVVDSYGWKIGKVIGFSTDSPENTTYVGIELNNGGFTKCKASETIHEHDSVMINNSWRVQADSLANEVALTMKKISALNELKNDVEVSKKIFNNLESGFDREKQSLLERRRFFKDRLQERMAAIDSQLAEVYEFITYIKINHQLGEIDEETYQHSYISFQLMIDKLVSEEDDIKYALNSVSRNITTLPPEPLKSLPSSQPQAMPIKLRIRTEDSP